MMIITRMEDKVLRFKKFFDLNFPKVKTFAWQLLKSEEDAEDIAQDIFVKLWEKPDLWLEREKLDSYLYTVVRNHIYNFLKHKAVEYDYLDVAAEKMQMAERGLPTQAYFFNEQGRGNDLTGNCSEIEYFGSYS